VLTPLLLLITCLQAEDDEERLEWKQAICESIPGMAAHAAGKLERSPVLKSAELQVLLASAPSLPPTDRSPWVRMRVPVGAYAPSSSRAAGVAQEAAGARQHDALAAPLVRLPPGAPSSLDLSRCLHPLLVGAYPPFLRAFRQGTVYWFSGYYKIKGNLVMTPGTVLDAPYHVKQHTKPHQFSIATPEMQRGGVCLTLQASDDDAYKRWTREIRAALEALPSVEAARTMTIRHKPGGTGGTGAALVPMASPRGSNGAS